MKVKNYEEWKYFYDLERKREKNTNDIKDLKDKVNSKIKEYPIEEELEEAYKKIDQLTNNWNELEKWCKNNLGYYGSNIGIIYKYVLDKMKEIKGR